MTRSPPLPACGEGPGVGFPRRCKPRWFRLYGAAPTMRARAALAVLPLLLGGAANARAQAPAPDAAQLAYARPEGAGCVAESAFRALVAANLGGRDPFVENAPRRISVTLSRSPRGGFVVGGGLLDVLAAFAAPPERPIKRSDAAPGEGDTKYKIPPRRRPRHRAVLGCSSWRRLLAQSGTSRMAMQQPGRGLPVDPVAERAARSQPPPAPGPLPLVNAARLLRQHERQRGASVATSGKPRTRRTSRTAWTPGWTCPKWASEHLN